jgi:hypothetical protein
MNRRRPAAKPEWVRRKEGVGGHARRRDPPALRGILGGRGEAPLEAGGTRGGRATNVGGGGVERGHQK